MTSDADDYAAFVEHPRFGRGPRFTGLEPSPADDGVNLHWNTTTPDEIAAQWKAATGEAWPYGDLLDRSSRPSRIPNTAIAADLSRQTPATVSVTHYFDLERQCRDCRRPFIFFAEEQKYWYEELGFLLDSDCIRCVECRKQQQNIAQKRELYESLFHVQNKTVEQSIQMADACLALIEAGIFTVRQTQRVRRLLNPIRKADEIREQSEFKALLKRLTEIEAKAWQ